MVKEGLKDFILRAWRAVFDVILPRGDTLKRLELMEAYEFLEQARRARPERLENDIIAFFDYRHNLVKTAIWEVKFRGNVSLARLIAQVMDALITEELSERLSFGYFSDPLLVPVPTPESRRRERGFNQCELIVREMVKLSGGRFYRYAPYLLSRPFETPRQTRFRERKERKENVRGSFKVVRAEEVADRNIILFDDVVTSGSTLSEARRVLLEAGARYVLCIAIAH